ncbi:MAG TPA: hypothetical protein VEO53_03135, partial [Candidatus Binatia bacterium]|nr:hypothetical protein [Candidatus Binatia bacterium]
MKKLRLFIPLATVLATAFPLSGQVPQVINYQGRIAVGGTNFTGTGQFKFALVSGGTNPSEQATAAATVVLGFLVQITLTSGGSGYGSAPEVTITDATGSGAVAVANVGYGRVVGVTVLDAGMSYSSSPTVTIAPPGGPLVENTFWSNDGTSGAGGEPSTPTSLPVMRGLYSAALGDITLRNMIPIPPQVFTNIDVRLRVWFNDGTTGFQQLVPDQRIGAVGYAMIAGSVPDGSVTSDKLADGAITQSKLAPEAVAANLAASGGVVFSLDANSGPLARAGFQNIGSVAASLERWQSRANGPGPRFGHSAVWTGTEMLVWGGGSVGVFLDDGGRYNPATDVWQPIAKGNAPAGRWFHQAVWTGTEMLVWGGRSSFYVEASRNDGGRYRPASDTWTPISTVGAPPPRSQFAAVWTGSEMLVWGGSGLGFTNLNSGGRYNLASNTWVAITTNGAPCGRDFHVAAWTGSEMIVWGGAQRTATGEDVRSFNDGGRYNPATDTWTPVSTNGAPPAAANPNAVWTGSELIVWGGADLGTRGPGGSVTLSSGGRYSPATDSWKSLPSAGAPRDR